VRLGVVLEMLCQRASATCKLPALMDAPVRPRTIRGSWTEVVAELVQGSGMSFGATPPAPGRAPYLFVEAQAAPVPSARQEDGARSLAAAGSLPPSAAQTAPAEEESPVDEVPEAAAEPEAATPVDPSEATLVTAATAAAMPDAQFNMTPFADGNGNPLLSRVSTPPGAPPPAMAVLPYSDEAGNPLVTPITNEPLSLTPFAGPDGQAWPAPVVVPGQKLEYPMSPFEPPTTKPENQ
jgi:hypothetical protein